MSAQGGVSAQGVSARMGGCLPTGVSVRGVSAQGMCLSRMDVCPWGCLPWGWQTPDPPVDRQTPVKTKPSETSFAGGKNCERFKSFMLNCQYDRNLSVNRIESGFISQET